MRAMSFAFIPAGGYVSAGTAILWVSNSAFAVVQVRSRGLIINGNRNQIHFALSYLELL